MEPHTVGTDQEVATMYEPITVTIDRPTLMAAGFHAHEQSEILRDQADDAADRHDWEEAHAKHAEAIAAKDAAKAVRDAIDTADLNAILWSMYVES